MLWYLNFSPQMGQNIYANIFQERLCSAIITRNPANTFQQSDSVICVCVYIYMCVYIYIDLFLFSDSFWYGLLQNTEFVSLYTVDPCWLYILYIVITYIFFYLYNLNQGLANYGLWTKSVNKVSQNLPVL